MALAGQKVCLRPIERSDIPTFVRWFNDPEVTRYLQTYMPMSLAEEERWFEEYLGDKSQRIFGIVTMDGRLVGNIGLHRIDWKDRQAMLGIVIGEKECWGQGFGSDAIRTLVRFAFREMNLYRVYLTVYEYNARALRCYERCGFQLEGRMRRAHFHDGSYHDELMLAVLREEAQDNDSQ